jgi:hypothetical protein
MRVLLTTTFGRLQLVITAAVLTLAVLNLAVLRRIDDPSLGVSVVSSLFTPLVPLALLFGLLAREELMRRDWIAFAAAMLTTSTLAAADVALGQHHDSAGFLLDAAGPLFLLTILCLFWSAAGRAR